MKVTYYEAIELSKINENDREYQPRLEYDEDAIKLLAEDITKNGQHDPAGLYFKGDHSPVCLRIPEGNRHEKTWEGKHPGKCV